MAFKWAVVVSTIAVKRSNRSAALEVGKYGGQTNSTNFHLGQGEARKGVSPSDSSFPALSTQSSSADGVIPETVAIFPASGRTARGPGSGSDTQNRLQYWYWFSWQKNTGLRPGISPNPPIPASLMAFKLAVVVSTIAVKRSNRAASLEAGRNGDKRTPLTSTSGRGRHGRGSVCLIFF